MARAFVTDTNTHHCPISPKAKCIKKNTIRTVKIPRVVLHSVNFCRARAFICIYFFSVFLVFVVFGFCVNGEKITADETDLLGELYKCAVG